MRMREAGLIAQWYKENKPDIHQCLQVKTKTDAIQSLTLKQVSLAFVALVAGFIMSVIAFVGEKGLHYYLSNHQQRKRVHFHK